MKFFYGIFCLLISAAFFTSAVTAQSSFTPKTDFPATSIPMSTALGDLNGDGKPDMIIGNRGDFTISVYLNTTTAGSTTPTFSTKTDFTTLTGPIGTAIADFNGDGKPDICCTTVGGSLSVFLNTMSSGASTPTFSAAVNFAVEGDPHTVIAEDMNFDGKPDLVTCNFSSPQYNVSVLFNLTAPGASTPAFTLPDIIDTSPGQSLIAAGDVNGDGLTDIVAANYTTDSVCVMLNVCLPGDTTAYFVGTQHYNIGAVCSGIFISDINNDGLNDITAVSNTSSTLIVLINQTDCGTYICEFSAPHTQAIGGAPYSLTMKDLNLDGKPDASIANFTDAKVSVLLNITTPGAATPAFETKADYAAGTNPVFVTSDDLNGDYKPDLAVVNYSSNSVSVFINTTAIGVSTPSFSVKTDISSSSNYSIVVRDFNDDGKPDVATANDTNNSISVYFNTTLPGGITPTFVSGGDFPSGDLPDYITFADFNNEQNPDLITANFDDNTVSVFFNKTAPGSTTADFLDRVDFPADGPLGIGTGDLNGDGLIDFAVSNYNTDLVSVYMNYTDPGSPVTQFRASTNFATGLGPRPVEIADFNGDGKPDIVVGNYSAGNVSVFLNNTPPGDTIAVFSAKTDFATGNGSRSISIKDVNGDGRADIISSNITGNTISVLINTTMPGSSTPSFTSAVNFVSGATNINVTDVNGDGKPDIIGVIDQSDIVFVRINTTSPGSTTPSFSGRTNFTTGSAPMSVSLGDINLDGKPDIVTANSEDLSFSVLLNDVDLPLPVELVSFASLVENQNVMLNWVVASEENNSGYEIERNSFGEVWKKIGFVKGAGTTSQPQNYSFNDNGLNSGRYNYRLKQIDYNGNYKYYNLGNEVVIGLPGKFSLSQNYPNPFNPVTKINYELPKQNFVTLKIYDISGREVMQLVNEVQQAGYYSVTFDGRNLSSGAYFYRLSSENFIGIKKMILIK